MQVDILTLCDNVETIDGKYSIIGLFDGFTEKRYPLTHPSCSVVSKISFLPNEGGTYTFIIRITGPNGFYVTTGGTVTKAVPHGQLASVMLIISLKNLLIPTPGIYSILLSTEDKDLKSIQFQAVQELEFE